MSTTQSTVIKLPDTVAIGGTGKVSLVAYSPVSGGTTSTGALHGGPAGQANPGYILTSNGSSAFPSFLAPNYFMSLLQTQTVTAVSGVTFGSAYITNNFSNYMVLYSDVSAQALTGSLSMLISTNNGSAWITNNYQSGLLYLEYNSATWTNVNSTTSIIVSGTMTGGLGIDAPGSVMLQNVTNGLPFQCNGTAVYRYSGNVYSSKCFATNTATNVNAITFYFPSGNIAYGVFSLYGIAQ